MALEEKLDGLWREMAMPDAEYELAERGLATAVEKNGMSGPEAVAAVQRLDGLGMRLLRPDGGIHGASEMGGLVVVKINKKL